MLFHLKPSDFIVFRPTFAILHLKTRLSFLQNELFRRTHLYNICMGFRGEFQSFFEKFSERRSHLPQNTQNSQNLLLDILPQIADADVGGYGILATPTQPLTSRGCSCLSCTNKADGIHVLGWCTTYSIYASPARLVHLRQVHPLEDTKNPLNPWLNPRTITI